MSLDLPKPDTNTITYLSPSGNHRVSVNRHADKSLTQLAVDAAYRLRCGGTVEWEPGDATRYVLRLIRADDSPWLCFLNLSKNGRGGGMLRLKEVDLGLGYGGTGVSDWCMSTAPVGGWRGVLPILIAGGYTTSPPRVEALDLWEREAQREASYRSAYPDTTPPIHDLDARLGREIRLLVTNDVAKHPRPNGPEDPVGWVAIGNLSDGQRTALRALLEQNSDVGAWRDRTMGPRIYVPVPAEYLALYPETVMLDHVTAMKTTEERT